MAKLDFYFDNKKVNEDVINWRDLEIEVTFEDESGQGVIKSGSLEFTGELAGKINSWNEAGMNGGAGIFEAPPFRIEACGNQRIFDGGINTAECTTLYECDKVIAPLRANTIDFMNDRAPSFSFAWLATLPPGQPGRITQSDYISVPYVINSIPDYVNVMVAGVSLFVMLKELHEILEKTVSMIEELVGDVTTAAASVGIAIANVVADILKLGFYILYLIFIVKAIIDLIQMIVDNLIQPIKYKKGMRIRDMFQRACDYLGLGFSSTLLVSQKHINDVSVPRKIAMPNNAKIVQSLFGIQNITHKDYDDNNNPKSTGYWEGTFADLILAEEARLNAEVRIIKGVLYFETKEYFAKLASYTLPNIKRKNGDPHGTNACELASNYVLNYALDDQDTNTYDHYQGNSCQMQLSPNVVKNKKNILLKNLTEVNLVYALAKRKTSLNGVEDIASAIYQVVSDIYNAIAQFINNILSVINKVTSAVANLFNLNPPTIPPMPYFPPNPIQARIGMMLLSSDFIGVPKIMYLDSSNKIHSSSQTYTAARTLIDDLHFTNFAVRKITTQGVQKNDHNQWLTYTDKEIPFCCDDYLAILNNNFIKTYDQKLAKVKSIVWNPTRSTAQITYRVKEQYTNNFNQTYVIDGGN